MLCIFCLLTNYNLLQVINHILSNSTNETVFRGPLSSTICATFLLSQSECGAQVFASNSLRSNYSSRCSHYSQNKFGILLSKNLAKVNAMRSSIYHQLPLLRVANLITYFTLRETFFRGPLSSTDLIL